MAQPAPAGPASSPQAPTRTVLSVDSVGKSYGHIRGLADVSFAVSAGEVVGNVGDNGAGKSALVNIVAGAIRASAVTIVIDGRTVRFASAPMSCQAGIEAVCQDLALARDLDVRADIVLGRDVLRAGRTRRSPDARRPDPSENHRQKIVVRKSLAPAADAVGAGAASSRTRAPSPAAAQTL